MTVEYLGPLETESVNQGGIEYLGPLDDEKPSVLRNALELPRALGETAATVVTGIPAWALGRTAGIVAQALTGDKAFADEYENDVARSIGFDPNDPKISQYTTTLGKHLTSKIGEAIGVVFGPIDEASRLPEESWNSPLLGKVLRFGGEMALPKAGKKIIPEMKDVARTVQDVIAKAKEKNIPLRQAENIKSDPLAKKPVEYLGPLEEGAKVEYLGPLDETGPEVKTIEPAKAEIIPADSIKLDVKVETPALPEVGAKGAESRLAIRTEADAIEAKLTEDFGDLVEYKTMNMKDQANRAAEVIGADYEQAKRMAMGTEKPPEGIREATMFEAVKIRAIKEGDVDTLQKLATESTVPTRLSEYGQAIKAADSRIMDDPVKVMQDVAKTRAEKAQKEGVKSVPSEEVAKLNQRVTDLEAALAERRAATTVEKIKNDVAKEQRQTKRTYAKEELSAEFDGLVKDLNKALGGQLSMGVDPMAALILGKMAKNRVQSGIITVEGLVDSIYTAVKNAGLEISKRDIMDAISGYGKYKQLSKDEILVQLRDLKGQMQQISKLEDLQNRQPPLKTGVERRIPSDEERRLIKLVEEAKRKYGIQSVDPATQLKSSLDSIKTRLTNQIADLESQIASREKIIKDKTKIIYDAEALSLKAKRDNLKKQYDLIFEGPKKTPEQVALQSLKTRLKNEEAKLVDQLKNLDFAKKDKRVIDLDPEAEKIKAARDQAKENYSVAAKASGTVTREEATTIVELSKVTSEARAAMEQGGDRLVYGAARVAFAKYADSLKNGKQTIPQMIRGRMLEAKKTYGENKVKAAVDLFKDTVNAISENSISIVASVDNSFIGRQGLNTLQTHPSVWGPAAARSFTDIYKTMVSKHGGETVRDAVLADAYSRPNYLNGSYEIAKLIPKTEEQFPTSLPERLPLGLGRVFKASENAFLNSGVRMRINTFDLVQDIAKKQGIDVTDKVWIKDAGTLINSITARGDLGKFGQGGAIRLVLWAPKMLKGNWDVLTAHTGGAGLATPFARQQARMNLLKIVGETAAVVAVANALSPGSAEIDPRSSDFLKIKVGHTRFDISGGKGSIITLLARAITFKSKSSETRKVTPLNSGKYGAKTLFDVGIDFLVNKTTPAARTAVDIAKGRNFQGTKPTIGNVAYRLTTPIGIQNFVQNFYGKDADGSVAAVVGSIVDMVGINASTYGPIRKK